MRLRHACLVLAAGAGRRLGFRDKAGIVVDGQTLLERTVAAAWATAPAQLMVVRRPEQELPLIGGVVLQRVDCAAADEGMAASLRAGVRALDPGIDGVLVLLLDQLALTAQFLQELLELWRDQPELAVASLYAGVPGVPAVLPRGYFAQLLQLTGDAGARSILRSPETRVLTLAAPELEVDLDE